MSVRIRLKRAGAKKRPYYHLVVADVRAPRDGKFIEKVGTYDPLLNKDDQNRVLLKSERIKYWIEKGAKPSDRVWQFLDKAELSKSKKPKGDNAKKAIPKKKAQERMKKLNEKNEKVEDSGEQASA